MISQIPRIFYRKNMKPIYLILNATNRCNSNCSTCFAWKYVNKNIDKELKLWEMDKISKSLDKIEWLLIGGGEPSVREDLGKIIKLFYKQNKVRRATISTNAILTEKIKSDVTGVLTDCPKLKLVITLSIDGVKEKHDEVRGVKGNFKHLENTYKMLAALKERFPNLSININTCLNNKNIAELDNIIKYCKTNFSNIDFHGFELLRGTPRNKSVKAPTIEEYKLALDKIKDYWKNLKFYNMSASKVLKAAKILSRDIELDVLLRGAKVPCFAGSIVGVIYAAGDVSLCELVPPIGNIRDYQYDFKKLWLNEMGEKQRASIKQRAGPCKNCTHSCFISSAVLFSPSLYPRLLLYTLKDYFGA